ncbi:MAG: ABC transporter permease [Bacteroidales bacterium]
MNKLRIFDTDNLYEIWHTLSRNKLRSILTMFGVGWGIFMLVIMIGAGKGLENGVSQGVAGFAKNSLYVGSDRTSEAYKGFQKGRSWNLRRSDIELLRQKFPEIEHISPLNFGGRSSDNVVFEQKTGSFNIKGLYPEYYKIDPVKLIHGRNLNQIDIDESRKVCVIGERVFNDIFNGDQSNIGRYIRVNGIYVQVVGVIKQITSVNINGATDESLFFPYSTMTRVFNMGDVVHIIALSCYEKYPMSVMEDKIALQLKSYHDISPTDKGALFLINIEKQFKMMNYLFIGINALIWIVGLGTLLAGVVGVSNIMVVTIQERTKEIGIRRALGAAPREILLQIINETVLLTTVAGLMGLTAGVAILGLIGSSIEGNKDLFFKDPQISFNVAVAATVILIISGLLAGLVPATRAMKIKAIEAIREE